MSEFAHTTNELYAIAIDAAIKAGAAIAAIYNRDFEVSYKPDQSPLTDADLASHNCIKSLLAESGLPLLSEEENAPSWSIRRSWSRYWLIDPLDGTKEFVKRNGEFTVNIALIEDGFPLFGVIFIPAGSQLYFGGQQMGSYRFILEDEEPLIKKTTFHDWLDASLKLPVVPKSKDTWIMLSSSHFSNKAETWLKRIKNHFSSVKTINVGSSIKFCRMAEGMVQLYPRFSPTMQWDTAAGQAIAEGAGMSVVSYPGKKRLSYHRDTLLNPEFIVLDPRYISPEIIDI
ncbi:MAG: 3'(2'),5'-bisphosphate nucleotidase CysQ [Lentimicrobium sp.]|jgi:3'(2'), 5'-bisphosphate nucleotidase|nr:3'(2'),5'-bisphosphate nucleotidase CysQ [Lentimicrobium sp.]MDD2526810.1 3'(2'),5'-bisphosphate nucleotidase CysQ [Lentimicrobiaceae bacterium]MDD4597891.1 3'(2'),5'-bisphosphate nucleotidase CysQ [Lentimicrobiaceae bacterium]MDY0024423.1 3'(2'),5'-bisphosphate nucleotidase CysQ [Lentimicrobium sp.]HAH58175.1 3'(2'),5'-bisphosphate nucleotidase [Bacteroidales bacterium]